MYYDMEIEAVISLRPWIIVDVIWLVFSSELQIALPLSNGVTRVLTSRGHSMRVHKTR